MQVELAHLIDALPGLAWAALPDGRAEFFNQRWLDYAGMTAGQAAGPGWVEAIHPQDRARLAEQWRSCLATGTPVDTEGRMRRFDGAYRWFLFRANPLRDDKGNVSRWLVTSIDIEDRRRVEDALRASELSWRQIVDNIPGLVATMGPLGEVEYLNRQTLEYFGKTSEELKDWSLIGVVHPDDLPRVIEARAKAIETGQVYDVEHRCRRADGVYRWFQVRGFPVRNAEGTISTWYLLLTDIDARKGAEEALRSRERDWRRLIDAIPTLSWCNFPDGSNEFLSSSWHEYTGLPPEESHGWGWQVAFHPDDLPPLMERWQGMLVSGDAGEIEARLRRHDGAYRWFLIRAQPLRDDAGGVVRWYGTSTDIDDRKRAEAQLEQAYLRLAEAQRLSKTGSFITDLLIDEHNWSEEAFRIFEFDPTTRITVQLIRDRVHPDDLPSFDAVIARGMTGTDVTFDFRILTARDTIKYVRGMARVMEQVAGRPLFIGALQDVTESRVAEEALNRARSELAHVARVTTLNALTASIAHEVNQPLSGIITNANTCLRMLNADHPNVAGARETVRRTLRDGNRATDVITRLRALFSKREFTLEPLDLNEATREVIALSMSDLQRNRVVLKSELADELPLITGDRVQLQQVMLNLIRNASDAMAGVDDRPRELLIKTEQDQGHLARMSVTDAGVGFKPEAAGKLFEAFYTTKGEGMGIGLSISRSIIEAHHGRLWGTNNDGRGATFAFCVPCSSEPASALEGMRAHASDRGDTTEAC